MIISHKYQYIYLPPPKTATTTVTKILMDELDGSYYTKWQDCKWETLFLPDEYALLKNEDGQTKEVPKNKMKHIIHVPQKFQHYFTFATVRNPYHRTISQYYNNIHFCGWKGIFEEFLEFSLPQNKFSLYGQLKQFPEYTPPPGCVPIKLDAILKVENLDSDFSNLPFVNKKIILPKLNVGKTKDIYTEETKNLVSQHRKKDFELFGYEM